MRFRRRIRSRGRFGRRRRSFGGRRRRVMRRRGGAGRLRIGYRM